MRKTLNRVLACFLSVALLVSCCISGLVLPAAASTVGQNLITDGDFEDTTKWTSDNYNNTEGYNDGRAFCMAADSGGPPVVTLREQLKENQLYVFRAKIKGGAVNVYNGVVGNAKVQAAYTANGWAMYQFLFTPSDGMLNKNTLSFGGSFYNSNAAVGGVKSPVYFDDFELYEYYAGMNLMPATDCELVPAPVGRGATYAGIFCNHISKGTTLSSVDDGTGNKVLKLTGVPSGPTSVISSFLNNNNTANNLVVTGKAFNISLRYKSAVAGTDAALSIVTTAANHGVVSDFKASAKDENGWITVSAKATVGSSPNANYLFGFSHSGAADILIDNFSIKEFDSVDIAENTATVDVGKTVNLNATAVPATKQIEWISSDPTIAKVEDGVVTGIKAGTVTITAKLADDITDTCTVTVLEAGSSDPATEIVIKDTTLHLAPKAYHVLRVKAGAGGGQVGQINWSSDAEAVATVDATGKVTAVADGTAVITGVSDTNSALTVTCTVTVDEHGNRLVGGDFEGETDTALWQDYTSADGGNVLDPADPSNGVFKLNPKQNVYLKVLNDLLEPGLVYTYSGRVKGSVSTAPATGAELSIKGTVDGKYLSGSSTSWITPTMGTDGETWSYFEVTFQADSNPDAAGTFVLQNHGEGDAYYDDLKLVKRVAPELQSFTVATPNNIPIIELGAASVTLIATPTPNEPDVVKGTLTWSSSNPQVATIDEVTGTVTARAEGTTTITVKNENTKQGTLELRVVKPATGMVITDTALHLAPKAFKTLAVTPIPADSVISSVIWKSSNPDVAKVDANGKVAAVADGIATITATNVNNPDAKASITVTVDKFGNRIIGGDFESDFGTDNWKNFTSDKAAVVADLADPTNQVLKLGAGKSGYYVFNDGLLESNSVYILSGRVKGAVSTGTKTGAELYMNGCKLIAGSSTGWFTPTMGTDGETWGSFAVTIQTPDKANLAYTLLLQNFGSVDSYYDDLKLVKRVPPTVETLTLSAANNAEIIVLGDSELTLTAVATPNQIDVIVGELTWTSSNPAVAIVSKTGDLTADVTPKAVGEATITVENAAGVKATYKVKVMELSNTIDITENTYTFGPEGMHGLTVEASPAGTYYGNLEWTSDNNNIVTVENGVIKGVSPGTAIITATSTVDPSVKDTITVIVNEYGNMLAGGDFEDDIDLGHWDSILDPDGKAGGSIIVDPDDPNNHVLTFKPNPSPNSAYYQYAGNYKLLQLGPEVTYVLTGRIKGDDKPAIGLLSNYVEHTATSGTAQWNHPEGSKEEWKEFELVFKTKGDAPLGIGNILSFGNFGVGICMFDDLKLQKQAPQTITGLTMLKEEATYGVGVTTQMNYTTTPQNADLSTLQWSSSNENVATVDQKGKVTTLAAGKTTITLKSSDTVKATCELTVVANATSFVLSKNALTLIPNATDTLITVSTPYGATIPGTLTWSSSDNAVATVNNGVVTAVADGTATITCTNGTLSASCTVKVSAFGELIIGGDFQDETLPDNWASLVNGTAAEVVDDPLVDGNRYLVLKAGQTTAPYTGLTLEADQLYLLTFRAKGYAATVNVNADAVASFYPSEAAARKTKNDASKWNTLTLRFRTKAAGALSDVLSFTANDYGNTFIDDISLVKVPALTGITFSKDSDEIAPSNSLQLTAKPVPSDSFIEGRIVWASSDNSIVSVTDSGKVTAGKEGNATITATVEGFAPATMDMTVDYYAPLLRNGDFEDSEMEPWWSTKDANKVTQFEVREGIGENGSNGLQIIGKQGVYYNSLDMVLIPNNVYKMTVRYKSKTNSLQNQRIWTNFGPGITLTNTKGEWETIEKVFTVAANWLPSGYQVSVLSDSAPTEEWEEVIIDSMDVRMFDSGVDANTASLNPPATTLTPGQSLTYMLAVDPSDANTNFMTWTSSNPDVVTVDNGTILAVGGGEATITATIPTSTGSVKAVATVTVEGEEAIIKNGSFDIEGDTSWTLTDATVKPDIGINSSNALVFGGGSTATQTLTGLKPGTVYIVRVRSYSTGNLGASLKIKQGATTFFNNSVPTVAGWRDSTFEFAMPDNYDGSPVTFEMATSGSGTSLYLDNVSITEGYSEADLIVSDIIWNDGATQIKPGTPVDFTVVIGNVGTEASKANRDIVVEIRVNTKTIRTFVHQGGILAGEMIPLTTDPNDPWIAEEGELVISAHVNTTLTVLESNSKNNGTQTFVRVADAFLEAPQQALDGGFNNLVFSDDFDTASVDTKFTGDYGYRWYMTDSSGMSGDETDFHLTGNSSMILEGKNMNFNWLLCTMDAKTGAGWLGFTHGYLEFRTRFDHNPGPDAKEGAKGPAIWSFPPQAIATKLYPKEPGEVHVEMDWMEYWGNDDGSKMHWTVTMHEQADGMQQWMVNHGSYAIKGEENDIGDGEWHTVGYRWEKGIVITYLDGREVMRQTWGPDGGNPSFNLQSGEFRDNAMMQFDNQLNALILAAAKGWPMEIDYIRVWQADGTLDAKPILDSTFLEDYLTDEDGNYFLEVTADNYEAIINAMDAWLELDEEQQNAINAVLVEQGGKEYGELLFEAQTLLNTVEQFVSFYAFDENGEPYTTVDETNYKWILTAEEEWNALTDVERAAINKKALELCGMTFEDMLAEAKAFGEGGGEGEIPSPDDGVPFPTVALVGLFLGGAAMIAGKKRRDEE